MYDNIPDAKRYLKDSVIRLGKSPIMVRDCSETVKDGVILHVRYLRSGQIKNVAIKDEALNFKPVPLGYGNRPQDNSNFFFSMRAPVRRWKQGLHRENMVYHRSSNYHPDLNSRIEGITFADMIQGRYKSFEEAFEKQGTFDRNFRIVHKIDPRKKVVKMLHYKGNEIGYFEDEDVEFFDEFQYLENYVQEVIK